MNVPVGSAKPLARRFGCLRMASAAAVIVAVGLSGGCASRPEIQTAKFMKAPAPVMPISLAGPGALLFTNLPGFSAKLVIENPDSTEEPRQGELLGRDGRLLLAPSGSKSEEKTQRDPGFMFLWNVANNAGYILAEVLQGYAPVNGTNTYKTPVVRSEAPSPDRVGGYACNLQEVTVEDGQGRIHMFKVWRAPELKGFPVRVQRLGTNSSLALTLSKVRLEAPPENLFSPPESFARYANPDVLMSEIVLREQNLRRKGPAEIWQSPAAGPSHGY
jgi:hypothetical protein